MRPLKDYLSISAVTTKTLALIKRFPISVLFTLIIAVFFRPGVLFFDNFFIGIGGLDSYGGDYYRLYNFLTLGVFVSAAAVLFLEDIAGYAKQCAVIAVVMLLLGVYCFSLPLESATYINTSQKYEIPVIGWVVFLSMYFVSFFRKGTDKAFWNFAVRMSFRYTLAMCFGTIIFAGLSGALLAIGALFNVNIPYDIYDRLMANCFVTFAQIYFLANIPDKDAKYDETPRLGKTMKALGLYVLAPLVAGYAVILYVYLFKIILTWELPKGLVSWLVSSLACGGFLTVTILYPVRLEEKNKAVVYMSRYFGLAMLPLLALMTVGIFRRFDDYGITIRRGYLIVMNVWLYGACLYHFITKARRVKWILISFTAVALLSSVRVCGVPDVTRRALTAEIRGYIGNEKLTLADSALFNRLGPEKRKKVAEKIDYLNETFHFNSVKEFCGDDIKDGMDIRWLRNVWKSDATPPEAKDEGEYFSDRDYWRNNTWNINGYNAFAQVEYPSGNNGNVRSAFKNNQLTVVCSIGPDKKVFNIPLTEEVRASVNNTTLGMYFKADCYTFLIDRFTGYYHAAADSVDLRGLTGYLFYNK